MNLESNPGTLKIKWECTLDDSMNQPTVMFLERGRKLDNPDMETRCTESQVDIMNSCMV